MDSNHKVNTILIASGGGTDANAIMEAYSSGFIPNISLKKLISTKYGAGCLEKADKHNIETLVIDRKECGLGGFNRLLLAEIRKLDCKLVFLVGCIVRVTPIVGVAIYNIHPAEIKNFGGKRMYGLHVHERVLLQILDLILRGRKSIDDRFFTYPTVHEVVLKYDSGEPLLVGSVEIPKSIIYNAFHEKVSLEESAELLQKEVLPYEWMMLPTAVKMAANKIICNL